MNRKNAILVTAGVAVVATGIVVSTRTAPRHFAAVPLSMQFIAADEDAGAGLFPALERHFEATLGPDGGPYPWPSYYGDGGIALWPDGGLKYPTLRETEPIPHPRRPHRWILPLRKEAEAELRVVLTFCANHPALPRCQPINNAADAGILDRSPSLPADWYDDSGTALSWADAGPPDDLDGGTL